MNILNFFKLQILALFLLSVLLILTIVRMPTARNEVVEFNQDLSNYHLVSLKKDSNNSLVSTSKDPYMILPTINVNRPDISFIHINVDYLNKLCGANLEEPASFIQVFWKANSDVFSEDKSDAAPISLGRSNYFIPLRSISRILKSSINLVSLDFRLDIVNKAHCRFRVNKIVVGNIR